MCSRINVITEADTRAVVTPECRIAVMTNTCREFQRRKNTPLILQVEGTVDDRTIINASFNFGIVLRKVKSCCHKMIAKLLIKLVTKSPCPNAEIIWITCRGRPCPKREQIIIVFAAGNTHLVLHRIVNLDIPNQAPVKVIIVPLIRRICHLMTSLILIRILVGTEVKGKIGRLAQCLAEMEIDRVRIKFRRDLIPMRILEVAAFVLLILNTPIPSSHSAFISDAVQLTSIAAVADAECRLHLLRFLRDDVDDAALCIRAVEG